MAESTESFTLIRRQCGGWLAVASRDNPIKIGATGDTEEQAGEAFRAALARWHEILASEDDAP